jgi:hypothetical protein
MTWLLRHILDLADSLARWYYNRKYGTLAHSMGREAAVQAEPRRGFIVIQIDGLAHEYLLEALASGYAPTLQRLVASGESHLSRWRCGLPSSTAAVQAGVMFGNNWDVPSFRWYEKDRRLSVVCKLPSLVREVQERVAAGRRGILLGGSSYVNMFDGGARLSLFTLAAWGRDRFFENVRGFGFLLLFLFSPFRVLRTLGVSTWEYLRALWTRLASRWQPGPTQRFTLVSPLLQIMVNVVFREIETFGVMLDVYRGVPCIWANYFGYDEVAHHAGPLGHDAMRALRGLDKQVRQIDRIRRQYRRREYDLIVLSDHGQSPSTPFRELNGSTLGEHIGEQLGKTAALDERWGRVYHARKPMDFLIEELRAMEREGYRSKRNRALIRSLRHWVDERVPPDPELGWDLERHTDVVVRSSGSLAHVYFNVTSSPMDLSEVAILYPDLVAGLLEEAGIGLILGRDDGSAALMTREGIHRLEEEAGSGHGDILASLPEPAWAAAQLARLASFPHSGDLVLLGAWNRQGEVVCFEDQVASHGGLGGPQDYPFMISPTRLGWDVSGVGNAQELYARFVEAYGLDAG